MHMRLYSPSWFFVVLGLFVGVYSIFKYQTSVHVPSQDQPRPATMISQTASAIYDALIIGGGPAGMSAALALARVNRSVVLFNSGEFRNQASKAMHTMLSRDGVVPEEFRAISRQQIEESYPHVSFQQCNIVQLAHAEISPGYQGFWATDSTDRKFAGRKLILATGVEDVLPTDIEGYKENWGTHIYQCLFCDGYEQRDYPIGMLTFPNPSYAHFALMALPLNRDLTIYSNGPVPTNEPTLAALKKVMATGVKLDERPVRRLINNGEGPEKGISIEFESGPPVKLGMLLHRPETRGRARELVAQLGLKTKPNGDIVVDPMMSESSVPGCVIAGDTMDSIKQVAAAVGTGVRAGAVVTFQLCDEEGNQALAALERDKMSNGMNGNL